MDNLENYLYLAFAVIYIISRILKARGKQSAPQKRPQNPSNHPQPQPTRKKAFSFDDIIKEFEKSLGEEQKEPFPTQEIKHEKPVPVSVKEVKKTPNKFKEYEGTDYKRDRSVIAGKEKSKPSREEEYAIKEKVVSEYVHELQTPEDFKKAFVLSEIINRKYF